MPSMSFSGTTQKCKACEKTVYLVDQLATDGRVYHRSCFRCHHCKGTLKLSNYSSFEGVLYCKPHFDQLFKRTGSLEKSFESIPRVNKVDRSVHEGQTNNRVSSLFAGTQDKCVACKKTVYPIEKVAVDGTSYHRPCFRCSRGGCNISPSNYVAHEGLLYCKHHHSQLFKEKGNFSQLGKQEQVQVGNFSQLGKQEQVQVGNFSQPGKQEQVQVGNFSQPGKQEQVQVMTENTKGVSENTVSSVELEPLAG